MFNGEFPPIRREDPSPSNLGSQAMNTTFNGEFASIRREDPSPSNLRSQALNTTFNGEFTPIRTEDLSPSNLRSQTMSTTNNLSASVPGPASGFQLDGTHIDFSQLPQHLLTPLGINIEGALQCPQLQRNPQAGGVYNAGPSHGPNLSNTTATGGGEVPIMSSSYSGPPTTLPNVPTGNGQAGTGNPATIFQVADQPPAMPWRDLHPDVFARPNEQGHGPLWRLVYAALDYEGGDDLRVVIHFRRIRPTS